MRESQVPGVSCLAPPSGRASILLAQPFTSGKGREALMIR